MTGEVCDFSSLELHPLFINWDMGREACHASSPEQHSLLSTLQGIYVTYPPLNFTFSSSLGMWAGKFLKPPPLNLTFSSLLNDMKV